MRIQVRVKPNSKNEEVRRDGHILLISVKQPPKEGKANQSVIKLLAQHFGVPQSQVRIISGPASRNKIVEILDK